MPPNQPPQHPTRTETPEARLIHLTQRLKFVGAVKAVIDTQGWQEVRDHIKAGINQFRRDELAVNPNDPDSLLSFNQRALFMAGKINGAEWLLNEFTSAQQEEQNLRDLIKETEAELKSKKNG